jgi:hypothetical protein
MPVDDAFKRGAVTWWTGATSGALPPHQKNGLCHKRTNAKIKLILRSRVWVRTENWAGNAMPMPYPCIRKLRKGRRLLQSVLTSGYAMREKSLPMRLPTRTKMCCQAEQSSQQRHATIKWASTLLRRQSTGSLKTYRKCLFCCYGTTVVAFLVVRFWSHISKS